MPESCVGWCEGGVRGGFVRGATLPIFVRRPIRPPLSPLSRTLLRMRIWRETVRSRRVSAHTEAMGAVCGREGGRRVGGWVAAGVEKKRGVTRGVPGARPARPRRGRPPPPRHAFWSCASTGGGVAGGPRGAGAANEGCRPPGCSPPQISRPPPLQLTRTRRGRRGGRQAGARQSSRRRQEHGLERGCGGSPHAEGEKRRRESARA